MFCIHPFLFRSRNLYRTRFYTLFTNNWKYNGIVKYIEYINIESFSIFVVARLDVTVNFYS